jgi:hypothetical protein
MTSQHRPGYVVQDIRTCARCRTGKPQHLSMHWARKLTDVGIAADTLFAHCNYCRLPYCIACRFKHQASHAQAVVTVRSVIATFDANRDVEACSRCAKSVSFRYYCCECSLAWCLDCWCKLEIGCHPHKVFNVVDPPRLIKTRTNDADKCCTSAVIGHCTTCATAFAVDQEMLSCKTCFLQSGQPVLLCIRCYVSAQSGHPRTHEVWQWKITRATAELSAAIHCNECLQSENLTRGPTFC